MCVRVRVWKIHWWCRRSGRYILLERQDTVTLKACRTKLIALFRSAARVPIGNPEPETLTHILSLSTAMQGSGRRPKRLGRDPGHAKSDVGEPQERSTLHGHGQDTKLLPEVANSCRQFAAAILKHQGRVAGYAWLCQMSDDEEKFGPEIEGLGLRPHFTQ